MTDRLGKIDLGILAATLLLLGLGIVFVYSSSFAVAQQKFGEAETFLARQAIRALLGIVCFVVFMNIDYHTLGRLSPVAFIGALVMLVYVLALPDSHAVNGAKRWIDLGFVRFQASEFARIAVILVLARQCADVGDQVRDGKVLGRMLLKLGVICGLIVLEPDFSTTVLVGTLGTAMLFMAGARFRHLVALVFSFVPVVLISVATTPYRLRRLTGFLDMSGHKDDISYQVYQSLIGLGNGGFFGVGLGEGAQKHFYLPEPHTDFAFAILGEELGFIGLLAVLALYAFVIWQGARVALSAPDKMGQLMAFGITFTLGLYVVLHTFVNTGLVPTTGVPLPFISYGGMSLVFTMASMGMLLNISSQTNRLAVRAKPVKEPVRKRRGR